MSNDMESVPFELVHNIPKSITEKVFRRRVQILGHIRLAVHVNLKKKSGWWATISAYKDTHFLSACA